jgi:chromosome segregation ATPase
VPGVEEDGLVLGRSWASLRAPEQPALGQAARLAGIERREARRRGLAEEVPALATAAESAAEVARTVRAAVDAQAALPGLLPQLEQEKAAQTAAETARRAAQERLDTLGPELGQLETELVHKREESRNVDARLEDLEPRVKRLTERVGELERQLEAMPLTAEQEAMETVPAVEVLESQRADLQERLLRFSDQERSPLVVAEHAEQQLRVDEVKVLVEDRKDVLDGMVEQVERAKRRYDEHINQTVQNLNRAFKEICGQAGMLGELERTYVSLTARARRSSPANTTSIRAGRRPRSRSFCYSRR